MKFPFCLALFCAGCLVIGGCDSDDPVTPSDNPPDNSPLEIVIPSSAYLNHRFFKLDLPGEESPGGRLQGDRIRVETIKLFRLLPDGPFEAEDIGNVAVYVDSTGFRNWFDIDFHRPYRFGRRWREIHQWDYLYDHDGNLIAVDLRDPLADEDVLAVVYRVELADGSLVQVGDVPGLDDPRQEVVDGDGLYYRMKLLKARASDHEPVSFRYVLRNIYSLGMANIDPDGFDLRIERNVAGFERPWLDETGLDYIRIFGLDRDDPQRNGVPDGMVDIWNPYLFDLTRGLLKFPLDFPHPFAPGGRILAEGGPADQAAAAAYAAYADTSAFVWNPSYLRDHQAWPIYDPDFLPTEFPQFGSFRIIVTHPRPGEVW